MNIVEPPAALRATSRPSGGRMSSRSPFNHRRATGKKTSAPSPTVGQPGKVFLTAPPPWTNPQKSPRPLPDRREDPRNFSARSATVGERPENFLRLHPASDRPQKFFSPSTHRREACRNTFPPFSTVEIPPFLPNPAKRRAFRPVCPFSPAQPPASTSKRWMAAIFPVVRGKCWRQGEKPRSQT